MRKQITVEIDPEDELEEQFLLDYISTSNRPKWVRSCLLVGYLVASGRLKVDDPDGLMDHDESEMEAEALRPRAGRARGPRPEVIPESARPKVGKNLFGLK